MFIAFLLLFLAKTLGHIGDISWNAFGVDSVHKYGCPSLHLFQAVNISILVRIQGSGEVALDMYRLLI